MNLLKIQVLFILVLSSTVARSQLIINEIMAANVTTNYETDFYNFPDWIELYNNGTSDINLSNFYISDSNTDLKKWKLPSTTLNPGKHYLLYCDKKETGRHTNFGLNTNGETLYLSNESGNIINQVNYPEQYPDISYGRNPSDLNNWYYCATPTPSAQNTISTAAQPAPKVSFTVKAGRLNSSKSLFLGGSNVRYTTNGTEPSASSLSYSQPLNINKTMVVKTKNFQDGYLPSETSASTYFLNEHPFSLPVVSLSYSNEYFYNNTIGIHVRGTNGISGNCTDRANWNQNWERAAYFEYFDENGVRQISQPVGVKVSGGCSRSFFGQKSLSVYARSKYGDSDFDYSFFKQKSDIRKYKSLFLRNSGNDFNATHLRDAFLQALVTNSVDLDYQSYQPAIAYFNGEYWGIMNIREKVDEDYFLSNYEISSDKIDFLEGILRGDFYNSYKVLRGTLSDYQEIIDFISSNNLANNANYNQVVSNLDLQEYINYMAVQIYIANTDWPGNNVKFWKKIENGKWRWVLYDTDFGFGATSANHNTIDFVTETNGPDWPNPPYSTFLFRKLMENGNFQNEFIRTILTLRDAAFHPDWCDSVMDSLSNIIADEIPYHKAKYGGTQSDWVHEKNRVLDFASSRYSFMPGYIESYFNLSSANKVVVSIQNPSVSKGGVKVNQAVIQRYPFKMNTYSKLSLSVEAIPAKGYKFIQWNNTGTDTKYSDAKLIHSETSLNLTIEPLFEPITKTGNIYLNEIAPITSMYRDEFDEKSGFVELFNDANTNAVLYSFFLSDDINNPTRYAIPDSTVIPSKGFYTFYLDAEARQGPLHTSFKADTDGEMLVLSQKVGETIHIIDSASFALLVEDHSYGRYSDGTGDWRHMVNITPGYPNDPDQLNNTNPIPELSNKIIIYPNPSNGIINISLNEFHLYEQTFTMDIIDISGKVVYPKVWLNSSNNWIYLTNLQNGLYFSRIYKDNLIVYTGKIIILK
jgi:hypothetical protein